MPAVKFTPNQKNLTRRYLIWCYKTTKEDLDRIDRYETQYLVDQHIVQSLKTQKVDAKVVDEFKEYMLKKKNNADQKKYANSQKKELNASYAYLKARLDAIESAIKFFLGIKELKAIVQKYEDEMTGRILSAREHT